MQPCTTSDVIVSNLHLGLHHGILSNADIISLLWVLILCELCNMKCISWVPSGYCYPQDLALIYTKILFVWYEAWMDIIR